MRTSPLFGITADFNEGRLSGFAGVNSYTGPYTAEKNGQFSAGPLAATLMAGSGPAMAAETAYLKLIEAAEKYSVAESKLTLTTKDGTTLVYEKAKPFTLGGSSWNVTGYNNGKQAVQGLEADSKLTLEFGTDGTASGNAGVNSFNGPYSSGDTSIKIGPLATTKMAGEPALMEQEQAYLAALQAATQWEVGRDTLTLRDAEGATQVIAKKN